VTGNDKGSAGAGEAVVTKRGGAVAEEAYLDAARRALAGEITREEAADWLSALEVEAELGNEGGVR